MFPVLGTSSRWRVRFDFGTGCLSRHLHPRPKRKRECFGGRAVEALPQPERPAAWPDEVAQYALDQCTEAALLADWNGCLLHVNQAASALLGYRAEELLELRLEEVLPELPRLLAESGVRNESVCQHRDGRRLAVEVVLRQPVVEGRGFQFALLREIGERKRLEDQLREARSMEVVGRMVASVSHDFNNLLTAILIYTGLLLSQLPAESPLRSQAEHVNVAAERGRSLVSQLTALGGAAQLRAHAAVVERGGGEHA